MSPRKKGEECGRARNPHPGPQPPAPQPCGGSGAPAPPCVVCASLLIWWLLYSPSRDSVLACAGFRLLPALRVRSLPSRCPYLLSPAPHPTRSPPLLPSSAMSSFACALRPSPAFSHTLSFLLPRLSLDESQSFSSPFPRWPGKFSPCLGPMCPVPPIPGSRRTVLGSRAPPAARTKARPAAHVVWDLGRLDQLQ